MALGPEQMTALAVFLFGFAVVLNIVNETRPMRNAFISGAIANLIIAGVLVSVIDLSLWLWKVAP